MEQTTIDTPTYTPAQKLAAADEITRLEGERNKLSDQHPGRTPYNEKILELLKIKHAPDPEPAPAGPSWQEEQQYRVRDKALRRGAEEYPEGHPMRKQIFDEVAARAAEHARGEHVPGAMTWADLSNARSVEGWSADDKRTLVLAAQAIGATPVESLQFQAAWADHINTDTSTLPTIDYRQVWGTEFEKRNAAFERAVENIPEGLWNRMVAAGVAKNPRLVNQLVAVGLRRSGG